jgi:predicted acyltransferase
MVFVNTTRDFNNIPAWSKHAGDFGLTYVDLIAPFFIFMMALNFKSSFYRRLEKMGRNQAYLKFIYRYLILLGLGLVLNFGVTDSGELIIQWGTLQVLGASGLIALPFIQLKNKWKLIIAIILLIMHQLILETPFKVIIYDGVEGGFFGALSWGAMMILSIIISDGVRWFKENKIKKSIAIFGCWGLVLIILGLILHFFTPINSNFIISRQYMTVSYSIISIGISSLVFFVFFYIFEIFGRDHPILQKENIISILGKNALILFIIHLVLMFISIEFFPSDLFIALAVLVGIINIVIIWIIGYGMNKAEVYIII